MSSYDVKVYKIDERKSTKKVGKSTSSYRVRWQVAGVRFADTFRTKALAESFHAKLITAQREGIAFDERCGLPEPMARKLNSRTWYEHAVAFTDLKWPRASAHHRKGIAETLTGVTMSLLSTGHGMPTESTLRKALRTYVFNSPRRKAGPPPADLAAAVTWVKGHTVDLGDLTDAELVRKVLDGLALKLDGTPAAAATVYRKRAVFSGALRYAVELDRLDAHPMEKVSWEAPKLTEEVDRGAVANQEQAARLLKGVRETKPELEAFYGAMYYAALRPEEVLHLRDDEYERPKKKGGWGRLHLTGAIVEVGSGWGDDEDTIEVRGLKHRAPTAFRDVPAPPPLCMMLDRHIRKWPPGPQGRLFVSRRGPGGKFVLTAGRPVTRNAIGTTWRKAREIALTPAEYRSPLAETPYHLRHACVSYQLSRGVSPALVAKWAGHSIKVLLTTYASWIFGEEAAAMLRIEEGYETMPTWDDQDGNEDSDERPEAA